MTTERAPFGARTITHYPERDPDTGEACACDLCIEVEVHERLVREVVNAAGQTTDKMCRDALLRAIGDPNGDSLRVPDGLSCEPEGGTP